MVRHLTNLKLSALAAVAVTGVALLARLPGFDGRPLFVDELWRALLILDPQFLSTYLAPTVENAITSPVYVLLVKLSAAFWISPDTLRLPSLLCGLLACLLAFALTRKMGGGVALASLAGLLFALNGNFIAFSNQMKPYTFEVCVHLAGLYVWLVTISAPRPSPRIWGLFFSAMALALLSTPSAIFLLPGFGLTLFVQYLSGRDMKNLRICTLGFAGLGVLVLALYAFSWRHGNSSDMMSIWAEGFSGPGEPYLGFLGSRLWAMWQASFQTIVAVPLLAALALGAAGLVIAWAVATGVYRQAPFRNCILFYLTLTLTLCMINGLRIWPLGALRPNLFLFGLIIMLPFLLAAQIAVPRLILDIGLVCGLAAFLLEAQSYAAKLNLPALKFRLHNYSAPIERSDLVVEDFSRDGVVGRSIAANCPKRKTLLIAEGYMGMAIHYLTKFDDTHRRTATLLASNCVQHVTTVEAFSDPDAVKSAISGALGSSPDAWFLHAHLNDSEVAALRHVAGEFGQVGSEKVFGAGGPSSAGYFKLIPKDLPHDR